MSVSQPQAIPSTTAPAVAAPTAPRASLPYKLVRTTSSAALFFARVGLGLVMFPHGAQKALGWFGGPGMRTTVHAMQALLHVPRPLAMLDIAAEFLGAIALVLGLFTRVAAFGIAVVMAVAILLVHAPFGFFMNWSSNKPHEGFEYHLLAITLALVLMLDGGGALSIDRLLARVSVRWRRPRWRRRST
jgi:putative oxidoreductase